MPQEWNVLKEYASDTCERGEAMDITTKRAGIPKFYRVMASFMDQLNHNPKWPKVMTILKVSPVDNHHQ